MKRIKDIGNLKIKHLSVKYNETNKSLIFDRELKEGSGDSIYGLEVCRSLDLEPAFIKLATTIRQEILGTNILLKNIRNDFDIIYLDPPYNQHGYGNNYYMFNVIIENKEPEEISFISGIPKNWKRSLYNNKKKALSVMEDLIKHSLQKTKYIILSYNNEGIIQQHEWETLLENYKNVEKKEIVYDTYKGSRNLQGRDNKVVEIMYKITK